MSKIMIITNHSYMLYRFRKELIAKLTENHEVVVSTPFVGHEEEIQSMGCKCIEAKIDRRGINPITDLKLLIAYYQLLRKESPDMVITYSIKPNIYAGFLCSILRIPYYTNVQGLGTAFQKRGMASFVTILYKTAFRHVHTVFFENKGNAQEFISRNIIAQNKIKVLNGAGINLEQYSYQSYPREEVTHFLYLGRIMKEKGIDELFSSMKKLKQEYKGKVILDLVGFFEDEYKEVVEELQNDGIVKFHGFQTDPRPYYEQAHCVVLPSYHEGLSNVLLEAAAMGRPIITSNIPGCRETVEDHVTGYLCEAHSSSSLYDRMLQFMKLDWEARRQMGIKGHDKVKEEFEKTKVVNETLEALRI